MRRCTDDGCVDGVRTDSQERWIFEIFVDAPGKPLVTASHAAGAKLASRQLTVDWQETTEPNGAGCDNKSTASPVTLDIP